MTIDKILATAGRLFSELGFDGTSTREIARTSGIAQSTLFHYFPNKEAIYSAISAQSLEMPLACLDAIAAKDVPGAVKLYAWVRELALKREEERLHFGFGLLEDATRVPVEQNEKYLEDRERLQAGVQSFVAAGVKDGSFEADGHEIAHLMIFGSTAALLRWYRSHHNLSGAELALVAARFAVRALLIRHSDLADIEAAALSLGT